MSTNTNKLPRTNVALVKPEYTDTADIATINTNMDRIVAEIASLNSATSPDLAENTIPANSSLYTYKTPGIYRVTSSTVAGTIPDCPSTGTGGRLIVSTIQSDTNFRQFYYTSSTAGIYTRIVSSSTTEAPPWYVIDTHLKPDTTSASNYVYMKLLPSFTASSAPSTRIIYVPSNLRGMMFMPNTNSPRAAAFMISVTSAGVIATQSLYTGNQITVGNDGANRLKIVCADYASQAAIIVLGNNPTYVYDIADAT